MAPPKLVLKNITAVCVDGREPDEITQDLYRKILEYMVLKVDFCAIKFLAREDPRVDGISFIQIPRMSRTGYSAFCLRNLSQYVDTDFCLVFQSDGFVLNPEFWSDDFFAYDYIGAPWPSYLEFGPAVGQQVGNGGFSLRSKRLLEATRSIEYSETRYRPSAPGAAEITLSRDGELPHEDLIICKYERALIEAAGLKIAPLDVARRFSHEFPLDAGHTLKNTFGFHGYRAGDVAEALTVVKKTLLLQNRPA
jgi:hypothetical protein